MSAILDGQPQPGIRHAGSAGPAYRPDIDGLRALAVLVVVLFHAWPNWLKAGFIGVDIFFVISGFLITSIIIDDIGKGRFSILRFYARRVRRIFPALILVLAATLLAGWAVLLRSEFVQLGKHVAAGAGFVANLVLWSESGYFDNDSTTKPLLHLWSLGVEEQFYIAWPLIVWAVYRYRASFVRCAALIFAASFGYCLAATWQAPVEGYFSPLTRFWELMAGGICAHLARHHDGPIPFPNLLAWGGVALLGATLLLVSEQSPFPGWWALGPVLGTCALVLAGRAAWFNRHVLCRPLLVRIGLASYPFYLWHWPLLSFAYIVGGEKPAATLKAALVGAALLLAWLTYRLLELPLKRLASRRALIGALCALMAVLASAGLLAAAGHLQPRLQNRSADRFLAALNDTDFPTRGMQPFAYAGATFQRLQGTGRGATVFLGDSVVEQYGAYAAAWLRRHPDQRQAIVFATAGGCPPIQGAVRLPRVKFPTCRRSVDAAFAFAASAQVDTVVIGAAWYGYFNPGFHELAIGARRFPDPLAQEGAYRALGQSLAGLAAHGKRVFLLLPPPGGAEFDPRSMIEGSRLAEVRARTRIAPFDATAFNARHRAARTRLLQIARAGSAAVIDPLATLCPGMRCAVLDAAGEPVYTDTVHMRPGYSITAAGYLAPTLRPP